MYDFTAPWPPSIVSEQLTRYRRRLLMVYYVWSPFVRFARAFFSFYFPNTLEVWLKNLAGVWELICGMKLRIINDLMEWSFELESEPDCRIVMLVAWWRLIKATESLARMSGEVENAMADWGEKIKQCEKEKSYLLDFAGKYIILQTSVANFIVFFLDELIAEELEEMRWPSLELVCNLKR